MIKILYFSESKKNPAKTKAKRGELRILRDWAVTHPLHTFEQAHNDSNISGKKNSIKNAERTHAQTHTQTHTHIHTYTHIVYLIFMNCRNSLLSVPREDVP